jgi:hypothetical protein
VCQQLPQKVESTFLFFLLFLSFLDGHDERFMVHEFQVRLNSQGGGFTLNKESMAETPSQLAISRGL